MSLFKSTLRKGFHMEFENGLRASVQWGRGNYCQNRYEGELLSSQDVSSPDAEVAVFHGRTTINANQFMPKDKRVDGDDVVGYLSADEVADFLSAVKNSTYWE